MPGLLMSIFCAASVGVSRAQPSGAAAPLQINLDAFEAKKKKITLPNGERLAYIDAGDPSSQAVVLIHGFTDNARDWVPVLPYLSNQFRLILVDVRGHGQSSKPECCYTRFDFAYDIKQLLDYLRIRKADFVGHSMGSVIAQTLAEFWPERTRRVVLISSTAIAPNFDFSNIRNLKEPIEPDSPFMIAWWSSPNPVNDEFIRRQRKDAAGIPLRVWLAVLDQMIDDSGLQGTLPRLKAPTLLIWGSADFIFKEPERDSLRKALPSAEVKVFEGLGHNPFWEDPFAVAATVNRFLALP